MSRETINSQASLRRTAILLTTLDEATSRRMLSKLSPLRRAQLRRAIVELADVDPMERRQAMREFLDSASSLSSPAAHRAMPPTLVASSPQHAGESDTPLAFLGGVPDGVLLRAIQDEHPQTIAIVLASLKPAQAARLLAHLDPSVRVSAVKRLASLEHLPPEALDPIGEQLRKLVAEAAPAGGAPLEWGSTGGRTLAAILEQAPSDLQQSVHATLGWEAPPLDDRFESRHDVAPENRRPESRFDLQADDSIIQMRVRYSADTASHHQDSHASASPPTDSDIANLDRQLATFSPQGIRDGLANLDGRIALLAVCGLPATLAERVLGTLPRRQAKQIRRQIQTLESVTLAEIDGAKQELAINLGLLAQGPSKQPSVLSTAA